MSSIFAQEKYIVPELSSNQKHVRVLSETYAQMAAGITFAKEQGVEPYDYGIFVGSIFAAYWSPEIGFEDFVNSLIRTWESLRTKQGAGLNITEASENTVLMEFPKNEIAKFLGKENPIATIEEFVEYFKGMLKPITAKLKTSATIDLTDTSISFTFEKK